MTDRRRAVALIGIASVVAATAAKSQAPWPKPAVSRPSVTTIVIAADTISFCATVPGGGRAAFVFARQTRQWGGTTFGGCPATGKRTEYPDSIALGSGVVATTVHGPDDEGRSFILLRDSARGRTLIIKPRLDLARIRPYLPANNRFAHDTLSATVSASVITDSLIWLGLAGGFQEGDGVIGGVIRVDRTTGTTEWILTPQLAPNTITALVSMGNWLWAGVVTPSDNETDQLSATGLARLDRRTGTWTTYTDSTSGLTSPKISRLASDGRAIAVATELGVSVVELRDAQSMSPIDDPIARWNSMFFVPTFLGDSMVFELAPTRQLDARMEAAWAVTQRFGAAGRERPLHAALLKLPTEALDDVAYNDVDDELGWKSFHWASVPDTAPTGALLQLLRSGWLGGELASEGIRALGPRTAPVVIDELRRVFVGLDTATDRSEIANRRATLGGALAAVGDTTATQWAVAVLDRGIRTTPSGSVVPADKVADLEAAIEVVGASHDPRGMSLLMAVTPLIPMPGRASVIDALVGYDTPQAWAVVIAYARINLFPRDMVLPRLQVGALRDPIVGARLRELLREELASGKAASYAAYATYRLRLIELVPDLIANLAKGVGRQGTVDSYYEALIRLTGRADAPVYMGPFPASAANWWNDWATQNAGKMTAVTTTAGEAAFYLWQTRRSGGRL